MHIIKDNKLFFITICGLSVIISVFLILIIFNASHLCAQKNQFFGLKAELQSLLCLNPSPIEKNIAVTTASLHQVHRLRDQWNNALGSFHHSKTPMECFLNIQKEIELIKAQAKIAKVGVDSKCNFGFLKYISNGKMPAVESLQALDRQCQIIKILSVALIQSNPKEILSCTREPILGESELDDSLLNVSSSLHLKIHDIFYSNMFKISFTGSTQTLRSFINKIEQMPIPIFIRNIQVAKHFDESPSQVMTKDLGLFSLTLELLDFKPELM